MMMRAKRKYRTLYSKDKLEISRYFEYCLSECQSPFCSSPVRAKGTSPWQNAGFDLPGNGRHPTAAGHASKQGSNGHRRYSEDGRNTAACFHLRCGFGDYWDGWESCWEGIPWFIDSLPGGSLSWSELQIPWPGAAWHACNDCLRHVEIIMSRKTSLM